MAEAPQRRHPRTQMIETLRLWLLAFLFFPLILSLNAQTTTNRVLELDGKDSFVTFPHNIFSNLQSATIEGWVKFNTLGHFKQFFSYGMGRKLFVALGAGKSLDFHVGATRMGFRHTRSRPILSGPRGLKTCFILFQSTLSG
jgi:hypothetical protein